MPTSPLPQDIPSHIKYAERFPQFAAWGILVVIIIMVSLVIYTMDFIFSMHATFAGWKIVQKECQPRTMMENDTLRYRMFKLLTDDKRTRTHMAVVLAFGLTSILMLIGLAVFRKFCIDPNEFSLRTYFNNSYTRFVFVLLILFIPFVIVVSAKLNQKKLREFVATYGDAREFVIENILNKDFFKNSTSDPCLNQVDPNHPNATEQITNCSLLDRLARRYMIIQNKPNLEVSKTDLRKNLKPDDLFELMMFDENADYRDLVYVSQALYFADTRKETSTNKEMLETLSTKMKSAGVSTSITDNLDSYVRNVMSEPAQKYSPKSLDALKAVYEVAKDKQWSAEVKELEKYIGNIESEIRTYKDDNKFKYLSNIENGIHVHDVEKLLNGLFVMLFITGGALAFFLFHWAYVSLDQSSAVLGFVLIVILICYIVYVMRSLNSMD